MTRRNSRASPFDYRSLGIVGIVALIGVAVVMLTNTSSQDLTGKITSDESTELEFWIVTRCSDGTLDCHTLAKGQALSMTGYTVEWNELRGITYKDLYYTMSITEADNMNYELKNKAFSQKKAMILRTTDGYMLVGVVNTRQGVDAKELR
ncbi:MAG TPA: hypothetical protein VJC39_05510 [Candidatus Nanoarchaeia archaeon]|nr:hypothetical protein [Candidatus Nanoarchaeia archaeon]